MGCYSSASGDCGTFVETGIDQTQCQNAAATYALSCCYACCQSTIVYGNGMTVDKCLTICTTNGFIYAGITG